MRFRRRPKTMLERYAAEHRHQLNRAAHLVGLPLLFGAAGAMVARRPRIGGAMLGTGVALQLAGHKVEGRPPAFVNDRRMLVAGPFLGARWWVQQVFGR